jgi:hypothetical protein
LSWFQFCLFVDIGIENLGSVEFEEEELKQNTGELKNINEESKIYDGNWNLGLEGQNISQAEGSNYSKSVIDYVNLNPDSSDNIQESNSKLFGAETFKPKNGLSQENKMKFANERSELPFGKKIHDNLSNLLMGENKVEKKFADHKILSSLPKSHFDSLQSTENVAVTSI